MMTPTSVKTTCISQSKSANTAPRRAVTVSSLPQRHTVVASLKQNLASSALIAGFAAAQITFLTPGPGLAETLSATTTTTYAAPTIDLIAAQPSVDFLSEASVADVITEIEDSEIPQLEAKMGKIIAASGTTEAISAAENQLGVIEREAALLAEQENGPAAGAGNDIVQKTGGLLSQISALKSSMRGLQ